MNQNINLNKVGLTIASGLLLTGAFPQMNLPWLAWIALAPLLIALRGLSGWERFRLGFLFGLTHYLTLGYWLTTTIRTYGHLPLLLCLPIVFLLAAYVALYPSLFCLIGGWIGRNPLTGGLILPLLWVAIEYLRAVALTGLPWEFLGHSQFRWLSLIQSADIAGVYWISGLIVLSNVVVALIYLRVTGQKWMISPVSTHHPIILGIVFVCLLITNLIYGHHRIQTIDQLAQTAPHKEITVIQGNIDQGIKWDKEFQIATTMKHVILSQEPQARQADLVVWPETAAPFYFTQQDQLTQLIIQGIKSTKSDFLIGSPSFVRRNSEVDYYNSAYLVQSDGLITGKYDKSHLVPFGEYVPFGNYLTFLGKLVEQVGDFQPGQRGQILRWRETETLGVQICYEIMFADICRAQVLKGADLLINMTNDAWYGATAAPYQHFSITVFRAVENKRALVRSANTGISGFFDPVGRIIRQTSIFKIAVIAKSVPILEVTTHYTHIGDLFAQACAGLIFLVVFYKSIIILKTKLRS